MTNALEAVGALIGERSKYEGWIAALATKTDVPPHVLEKVRTDYTGRLRTVLQAFTAHTPALEAALAEHQARDTALAAQEKSCRDEHAEGELRHMVGEYDSAQWDQVRIGHEAMLSRLATDRQGIALELASVQRSLAGAAEAAQRLRALGSESHPAQSPVVRDESPTPAILAAMSEPVAPPPSVVQAPDADISPSTYRPTPPAPPQELMDRRTQLDDLGFLRSSPRPAPRENGVDVQVAPIATASRPVDAPVLRIVPDEPAVAPPPAASPVDAAKTLRCAECGTMNYATEWYCERCGGELAVL
ncbi:MAG: hypothetical protein U5K74_06650 [Gemmatimonadaceae bacterium]|nr:hypothetical protein [Gemmatimonadaceae bacterium]